METFLWAVFSAAIVAAPFAVMRIGGLIIDKLSADPCGVEMDEESSL